MAEKQEYRAVPERQLLRSLSSHVLREIRDSIEAELQRRDVCEHGVRTGDWCEPCAAEYRRALVEPGDGSEGGDSLSGPGSAG